MSNMTPCQYFDEDEFIKRNRKSDECLLGEILYLLKDLNTKFDVIILTEIGSKNISVVEKWIPDYNFHYVLQAKETTVEELVFTLVIHWPMLL